MTSRVLVVDDSPAMCAVIGRILREDPELEVVGFAREPHEARALIKTLDPDVLTLDVEMPGMDGLTFLERIMRLRPMPVVMCSTLTARGAEVTVEALRLGAVDCVAKPSGTPADLIVQGRLLRDTVKAAASSRVRPTAGPSAVVRTGGDYSGDKLILVGASTGGVEALFAFLGSLPFNAPPVVVVQHMPEAYTAGFAQRLDAAVPMRVRHGSDGQVLQRGEVIIAPGGKRHARIEHREGFVFRLRDGDPEGGHRPSVDHLFASAVPFGDRVVGVLLTGMGRDGANGLLALRQAGAATFAQAAETCVVYGMPRAAVEMGAAQSVPLGRMAEAVLHACRRHPKKD